MMICERCKLSGNTVEMVEGRAIDPKYDDNARYIVGTHPLKPHEVELIDVLKCPVCGHTEYIEPTGCHGYQGCRCICHRMPNVRHCRPCCYPSGDSNDR